MTRPYARGVTVPSRRGPAAAARSAITSPDAVGRVLDWLARVPRRDLAGVRVAFLAGGDVAVEVTQWTPGTLHRAVDALGVAGGATRVVTRPATPGRGHDVLATVRGIDAARGAITVRARCRAADQAAAQLLRARLVRALAGPGSRSTPG